MDAIYSSALIVSSAFETYQKVQCAIQARRNTFTLKYIGSMPSGQARPIACDELASAVLREIS